MIAKHVRIVTLSHLADEHAIELQIEDPSEPVEARISRDTFIGTQAEIQLKEDVRFVATDFLRHLPDHAEAPHVEVLFNGTPISRPPLPIGDAADGLRFISFSQTRQGAGFRLRSRVNLVRDGDLLVGPAGLSFQNLQGADARIRQLPNVARRIFVRSIPLVTRDDQIPPYPPSAVVPREPLFWRLFVACDLFIDEPGRLDLNLARNAVQRTTGNDEWFRAVDVALLDLIAALYETAISENHREGLAERLWSELWLQRIGTRVKAPLVWIPQEPSEHLDVVRKIWDAITVVTLEGTTTTLGQLTSSGGTLVWLPPVLRQLMSREAPGSEQAFMQRLRGQLGHCEVVCGLPYGGKLHEYAYDLFAQQASSIALLDVQAIGLANLPPLAVLDYRSVSRFANRDKYALEVIGSKKLFVGTGSRTVSIGNISGNNAHEIVINLAAGASAADVDAACEAFGKYARPVMFSGANSGTLEAVLVDAGVSKDVVARGGWSEALMRPPQILNVQPAMVVFVPVPAASGPAQGGVTP